MNLIYLAGIAMFFHGVYQLLKFFITASALKCSSVSVWSPSGKKENHRIFVLAPVLHEESTLLSFLSDLSRQRYPRAYYSVYVITTQKEYASKMRPNTIDILKCAMSDIKFKELQIVHLHYPYDFGFKAHQLNFAFKQILKEVGEENIRKSFFLLLDCDSVVDETMLQRFNYFFAPQYEIYQQPRLWFKNLVFLKSPFMQSFSFLQSFFSIAYEAPMFADKFFSWRLKHFVGDALCIKGSLLLRINGFPDVIEDTRLGRIASFLNIKSRLIPYCGMTETAKSFSIHVKQASVWFFGCGLFLSDYISARKLRTERPRWRDYMILFHGFFKLLRWLNKGFIHILGFFFAILFSDIYLFAIFAFALLLNSIIPVLITAGNFYTLWTKDTRNFFHASSILLRAIVFSPFMYMFAFIGPYYGLLKLLKYYLCGKVALPKTER